jgi:RHS repeat-associated protein
MRAFGSKVRLLLFVALLTGLLPPAALAAPGAELVTLHFSENSDGFGTPFRTFTNEIDYPGGFVLLAACPGGDCWWAVDDEIWISVNGSSPIKITSLTKNIPPLDLTALFEPGNNTVTTQLVDRVAPLRGAGNLYIVTTLTAPTTPTLIVESVPTKMGSAMFKFSAWSRDPVNTYTGAFTYTRTDISTAGRGPTPAFTRSYNSADTRIGPLGPGWTHTYNVRLVNPDGTDAVALVGPTGATDIYQPAGGGDYTPPVGTYTTLRKHPDGTYTATHKDLSTWTFNAAGRLNGLTDRFGNLSVVRYDDAYRVASVSDPAGRGDLTFGYDGAGRLTRVTDWLAPARVLTFGYDASGRLASVTDRMGATTTYTYDGPTHRLVSIKDALGRVAVTNTYDAEDRVLTQKDARGLTSGQLTEFAYLDLGSGAQRTTVIYPRTSVEPAWRFVQEDTYDGKGQLTARQSKPVSDSTEWATQQFDYDALSNRISTTDARGNETLFCYDVGYSGAALATRGNLTRIIEPASSAGTTRAVTLMKYDASDNLVQVIRPKGVNSGPSTTCASDLTPVNLLFATNFQYDAATTTKLLAKIERFTDPELGLRTATTRFEYNDAANPGALTGVITPRGNTGPSPNYTYATTSTYYTSGSQAGLLRSTMDPAGTQSTFSYDSMGRLLTIVGTAAEAGNPAPVWETTYDAEDRVRFETDPAPSVAAPLPRTETRYDAVGNVTAVIDANNKRVDYAYDERDALRGATQTVATGQQIVTAYEYDDLGNLTRTTRGKGRPTIERAVDYRFDGLGRLRSETQYPAWPATTGALVTRNAYDLDSNVASVVDALGRTTRFTNDAVNRLTAITYSDGTTPSVAYTYDSHGNRLSMTDVTGRTQYSYDQLDRLLSVASPSPNGAQVVAYRYDLDGDRRKLIYPDGTAVTYRIDAAGRTDQLTDWQNRVTGYVYKPDGSIGSILNLNGTRTDYTYDAASRLRQVWNRAGANSISQHRYQRDAVGNVLSLNEALPQNGSPRPLAKLQASTTTYTYDGLYELTRERNENWDQAYAYDGVGNRTRITVGNKTTDYAYDRADRIRQDGKVTFDVDAVGNVLRRGKETFQYDQANRLISSRTQGPTSYIYNGDGLRVRTNAGPGPVQTHVYDVAGPLPVLLHDGRRKYVWGPAGAGLGLAYTVDGNGPAEVYHPDGLGSVRAITHLNGNVSVSYRTDAFGVPMQNQGTHNQPFQFGGEERDKESGLIYLRARYYDPTTGRFMSSDPVRGGAAMPLTLNPFAYSRNDPVNRTDPGGRSSSLILDALAGLGRFFDMAEIGLPGEKLLRIQGYLRQNGSVVKQYVRRVPGGAAPVWNILNKVSVPLTLGLAPFDQYQRDTADPTLDTDARLFRISGHVGFTSLGLAATLGAGAIAVTLGAPVIVAGVAIVGTGIAVNLIQPELERRFFDLIGAN